MTQAKWVRLTRLRNAQDYSDLSRPLEQCYTASAVSGVLSIRRINATKSSSVFLLLRDAADEGPHGIFETSTFLSRWR